MSNTYNSIIRAVDREAMKKELQNLREWEEDTKLVDLSEEERAKLFKDWNNTVKPFRRYNHERDRS